MMSVIQQAQPLISLSEAQAFVRVETGEEEALLSGLIRSASALCESFINQVTLARPFEERLAATDSWQQIEIAPVRAIDQVAAIGLDGAVTPLPGGSYAIDIDARGCGWVRANGCAGVRGLIVQGTAGLALEASDLPEPLRQGVVRLVAHLFASRDGDGGEPPAAVTALWRPYRRMRLS